MLIRSRYCTCVAEESSSDQFLQGSDRACLCMPIQLAMAGFDCLFDEGVLMPGLHAGTRLDFVGSNGLFLPLPLSASSPPPPL